MICHPLEVLGLDLAVLAYFHSARLTQFGKVWLALGNSVMENTRNTELIDWLCRLYSLLSGLVLTFLRKWYFVPLYDGSCVYSSSITYSSVIFVLRHACGLNLVNLTSHASFATLINGRIMGSRKFVSLINWGGLPKHSWWQGIQWSLSQGRLCSTYFCRRRLVAFWHGASSGRIPVEQIVFLTTLTILISWIDSVKIKTLTYAI